MTDNNSLYPYDSRMFLFWLIGKVCFHDNQMYMPWEKFADKACTGWCTCNGLTGSVGCVSLCPLAPPRKCPPGTEARIKNVPSGDKTGRCTCKRQVCGKYCKINITCSRPTLLTAKS